jgi:flagella basal body P-ring formation protein FlgA
MQNGERRSGGEHTRAATGILHFAICILHFALYGVYAALAMIVAAAVCPAAEIQFRGKCQPLQSVVTLGDVAEIRSSDPVEAKSLAAVELFPTPAAGQQRVVRGEDIEKLLSFRPVNVARHRFAGAVEVIVAGPDGAGDRTTAKAASPAAVRKAETTVRNAIAAYLKKAAGDEQPWNIELQLSGVQAARIPADARRIAIDGGQSPYTGRQSFEVRVEVAGRWERMPIDANVTAQPPVVVAVAAIPRGALVRADDVELVSHVTNMRSGAVHSLEAVVGREATRSIPKGAVVATDSLSKPVCVRAREIVTVYSRCGGITVRTAARARQEGSQGDLIAVETLHDRRATFTARVCGLQEVEVYASAPKAADTPIDNLTTQSNTPAGSQR